MLGSLQVELERIFRVQEHGSSFRQELLAGLISFVTGVYAIVVNASIMAGAGIPLTGAAIASALAAAFGSLIMGFWANAPLMLFPGISLAALFTHTLVDGLGLVWQEAIGVVTVTGLLFSVVAFTPLAGLVTQAIPDSLKNAIAPGVGLFLAFIGLKMGGLVVPSASTFVTLGDLRDPRVLLTLATLVITFVLYVRGIKGSLLISIVVGTLLAAMTGQTGGHVMESLSLATYAPLIGAFSFSRAASLLFWIATYSYTMVVLFGNLGLIYGLLPDKSKFQRSLQANAISVVVSGVLGCTPTLAGGEGAAGIAAGGRTGLTAITAGLLFLFSVAALPLIGYIPDSAVASILILVGVLTSKSLTQIPFGDLTEAIPAFLVIALMPLTFSISQGLAFGFIAYPVVKLAAGRGHEVSRPLYVIAGLFLLYFIVLP